MNTMSALNGILKQIQETRNLGEVIYLTTFVELYTSENVKVTVTYTGEDGKEKNVTVAPYGAAMFVARRGSVLSLGYGFDDEVGVMTDYATSAVGTGFADTTEYEYSAFGEVQRLKLGSVESAIINLS